MSRSAVSGTFRLAAFRRLAAVLWLLVVLPAPADSQGTTQVSIEEWTVPWSETRPRGPFVADDGRVWFVGQIGDYVATLDPTTGKFERHDLPEGTGPHNLIVAESGTVYLAGNRTADIQILESDPTSHSRLPMPDSGARDPHTLVFAPDSSIWLTVQHGNRVGHLRPGGSGKGSVRLVTVPTPNSRPYGIVVDSTGRPWFLETGLDPNRFVGFDPATEAFFSITPIPSGAGSVRHMFYDRSREQVWFGTDAGTIGRAVIDVPAADRR